MEFILKQLNQSFTFSGYEIVHITVHKNITEFLNLSTEDLALLNSNILLIISLLSVTQAISYYMLMRRMSKLRISDTYSEFNN